MQSAYAGDAIAAIEPQLPSGMTVEHLHTSARDVARKRGPEIHAACIRRTLHAHTRTHTISAGDERIGRGIGLRSPTAGGAPSDRAADAFQPLGIAIALADV